MKKPHVETLQNEFKKLVELEKFDLAENLLTGQDIFDPLIKNYNFALLKYKQNDLLGAHIELMKSYKGGLYHTDGKVLKEKIEQQLGLSPVVNSYSLVDTALLKGSVLGNVFFINITLILIGTSLLLALLKKKVFSSFLLLTGLLVGGFAFVLGEINYGIIKSEEPIWDGPSKIFEQIQLAPAGAELIYEQKKKDWVYVSYPESLRGWIYQGKIEKL